MDVAFEPTCKVSATKRCTIASLERLGRVCIDPHVRRVCMDSAVSQIEDVGVVRNSSMATSKHRIHRVSLVRGLRVVDLGKRDNNICTFKPVMYTVRRSVVKRANQDLEVVELLIQSNEAKLPCCALPVLSKSLNHDGRSNCSIWCAAKHYSFIFLTSRQKPRAIAGLAQPSLVPPLGLI